MPVLGTGAAGFEFETGAELVCEEVWAYTPETLSDVRVIAYSTAEYEALQGIADQVRQS